VITPARHLSLTNPSRKPGALSWEDDFHFDDSQLAKLAGAPLSSRVEDLLDIAVAAYLADRLNLRHPRECGPPDGSHWIRDIPLTVPVRDPAFWTTREVRDAVDALLHWLTDDQWRIELSGTPAFSRSAERQGALVSAEPPRRFGLFSGGLDSLLGAATDIAACDGPTALISVCTGSRLRTIQHDLVRQLEELWPRRVCWAHAKLSLARAYLDREGINPRHLESSQRTRGLVFLATGAAAAISAGASELRVYENGPGAMNLPLSAAQHGSQNTRAMHPRTLQLAGQLFALVAGRPFEVVNPNFWSTKAEMVRGAAHDVQALIPASVTCDSANTSRRRGGRLCGHCTSCVLRRQALRAGGLTWADELDVQRMRNDVRTAGRRDREAQGVLLMLGQAMRLEHAVQEPDPGMGLLRAFPELRHVLHTVPAAEQAEMRPRLAHLYSRYADEWRALNCPLVETYLEQSKQAA
jgi:hypothetical protein